MSIWLLRVKIFKGTQRFQVFHGMRDIFKGIKNPKLHSPRSKFFKVSRVLIGFNFKGLKG